MKIGQITEEELMRREGPEGSLTFVPAAARAAQLLLCWLETVNQAGLEGKKLTDLAIVQHVNAERGQTVFELHAKVQHRLARQKEDSR